MNFTAPDDSPLTLDKERVLIPLDVGSQAVVRSLGMIEARPDQMPWPEYDRGIAQARLLRPRPGDCPLPQEKEEKSEGQ